LAAAAAATAILVIAGVAWWREFHRYTPAEVVADIRAGIKARYDAHPVERFLELRYGPLTEAENRRHAFLDFFNVGHIQGLQLLSSHLTPEQRRDRCAALGAWLGNYRTNLTAADRQALRQALGPDGGKTVVRVATDQYLGQDARYRAASAPVITELLTTLTELQKPDPVP